MVTLKLKKIADRFDSLVIRERLLLVGAGLAAIYMIFDFFILGPVQKQADTFSVNIITQKKQLDSLKAEELILTKVLTNDPNIRLKKELEELTSHLAQLDADIVNMSAGLVPVQQLAVMLQDVLKLTDKLQIQQLNTMPPEKINLNPNMPEATGPNTVAKAVPALNIPELNLYRQGVKLVVQGSYFEVLDYIKQLEATPWRFYWDALNYKVLNYPVAEVELQVYTLSVQGGIASE